MMDDERVIQFIFNWFLLLFTILVNLPVIKTAIEHQIMVAIAGFRMD